MAVADGVAMTPESQLAIIEAMPATLTHLHRAGRRERPAVGARCDRRVGAPGRRPARRRVPGARGARRRGEDVTTAIALIGARSGSERVPGKNVRPLAGHPLLAYAISTAQQAGVFDRVVVSTDSDAIAESPAGTAPTSRSCGRRSTRPPPRRTSNGSPTCSQGCRRRTTSSRSCVPPTRSAGRT